MEMETKMNTDNTNTAKTAIRKVIHVHKDGDEDEYQPVPIRSKRPDANRGYPSQVKGFCDQGASARVEHGACDYQVGQGAAPSTCGRGCERALPCEHLLHSIHGSCFKVGDEMNMKKILTRKQFEKVGTKKISKWLRKGWAIRVVEVR